MQLPVYSNENGELGTGFYAGRSHRIVPCRDCLLQPQIFTDISTFLCELLLEYKVSAYSEEKHVGTLRHVFMRLSEKNGTVMLCLVINSKKMPFAKEITEKITAKFPQITSLIVNTNRERTNIILGRRCETLFGDDYLTDVMSNVPVKLNPLSFYQVNTQGAEQLYAVAANFAQLEKTDVLLDLYCGTGTIGLSMSSECKEIIGVEIIPEAIANAKQNADEMGAKNATFICADACAAAKQLLLDGVHPDVILLDPPRKGCEPDGLDAICQMLPKRIVMVSCNAATAARDCAYLLQNGYKVCAVQPIDMFPRTKHVECVVLMSKIK